MIHSKPQYQGELKVWESLSKNLPGNIVVYNHKEVVEDRQFDFTLLIPDLGLLVIEVKGWQAKYIFDVTNDNKIIMTDSPKPENSPADQARGYRFDWVNFLENQFGISPVVLSMVGYPFISEIEYKQVKLNSISKPEYTLFKEDFNNPAKLGAKIYNIFKKKGLNYDKLDSSNMAMIRQYFEPAFKASATEVKDVTDQYSILRVFANKLSSAEIDELIDMYFAGTKVVAFVPALENLCELAKKIVAGLNYRKLVIEKNNLRLAKAGESQTSISCDKGFLRLFNMEIYSINKDYTNGTNIGIVEGEFDDATALLLKQLSLDTSFNFDQYAVEHATTDKNILVRAGAGTGKTYSMVSRIAYLFNKRMDATNNLVDEIAMVTFTNDAAENMKSRLKQLFMNYYLLTRKKRFLHAIEAVDLMQISTIHMFAKKLLQSTAMSYGLGHDFSITSSSFAKNQIYEKYLDEYLQIKNQEVPNFSRQLKMPVYKFRELLMNFSAQLYNKSCDIKTIKASELGTFDEMPFFNEVIEKVIIPAEQEYADNVFSRNKIDLSECMILLNQVVNGDFSAKCDLHYRFLFIDEFQDTDDVQIDSFLKLQKIMDGVKLFVVGDLKQSIYRFRGATVSAFDLIGEKKEEWTTPFHLTTNYRSDYRLLKKYDEIFRRMVSQGRLPQEADMPALTSSIDTSLMEDELVRCVDYSSKEDEKTFFDKLFSEIDHQKKLISSLKGKLSKEEKCIAILVRENWQIEKIIEAAKQRNVYIETEVGGDLYQLAPAIDMYQLILALLNPGEPVYLYNLIKSNYVGINMEIQGLHGMTKDEKLAFLNNILNQYFVQIYKKDWTTILQDTRVQPVLMLLRNLYEAAQPWRNYDENESNQRFYMANYELVLEKIIKMYSVDYLTLSVMGNSLHINILTKQKEMARNIDVRTDDIRVLCKTVHKSKGLEYGTVILPYGSADIGSMKKAELDVVYTNHKLAYGMRIGNNPVKKYNSNYDASKEKTQRIQEESRVFYVALTRAIRNFVWFKDCDSKSAVSWQRLMEE